MEQRAGVVRCRSKGMAIRGPVSGRGPRSGKDERQRTFRRHLMSPAALWYSVSENVTQSDRRRMPGEQILEHLSELTPTDAGNYDTLSLNQKNVRQTGLSPVKRTRIYAKESGQFSLVGLFEERRLPTLPPGRAVPSAMTGLASLFGMGRGGSPSL